MPAATDDPNPSHSPLPIATPICGRMLYHGRDVAVFFTRHQAARWRIHRHQAFQIIMLAEAARGMAFWRGPKGQLVRRPFKGAQVWIVPPGLDHAAQLDTDVAIVVLLVRERFIRRITGESLTQSSLESLEHYMQADKVVSVLGRLFLGLCQQDQKVPKEYVVDAGATLAHHLIVAHLAPRQHLRVQARGLAPSLVERAIGFLRARMVEGCDFSGLARSLNMSPGHFGRMFKLSTGCTPGDFLSNLRREKAEELLPSGRYRSVTEVAHAVGCYDHSHLNKLFRKKYDLPAGLFLRKMSGP